MLKLVLDFDYSTLAVVVMLYVMWLWRFISSGNKYDGMFYDFILFYFFVIRLAPYFIWCYILSFRCLLCDLDHRLSIIPLSIPSV